MEALQRLPPAAVEHYTGKSLSLLRKCSNPMTTHALSFRDAARIEQALLASGHEPMFEPLFRDFVAEGAILDSGPAGEGERDALRTLAFLQAVVGKLAEAVGNGDATATVEHAAEAVVSAARAVAVAAHRGQPPHVVRRGAA